MRLNSRGQAAYGKAGGPASVDGKQIATIGGEACWLDDDNVIYNTKAFGQWQLFSQNIATGGLTPQSPVGVNDLAAYGGKWAGWLDGTGVFSNFGFVDANAGLADLGPGGLAYIPNRQLGSPVQFAGAIHPIAPRFLRVTDLGVYVASTFDRSIVSNLLGKAKIPLGVMPFRCMARQYNGVWYLLYQTHTSLLFQRYDAPVGRIIKQGDAHSPDFIMQGDIAIIKWCKGEGEGTADLEGSNVYMGSMVNDLSGFADMGQPPIVIPPVVPPVIIPNPVPKHMEAMKLPEDVQAIVDQLYARNLVLANGDDDQRRELAGLIAETTRARKGPKWGWKSNHGIDGSRSKDGIAFLGDQELKPNERQDLFMWDLFNGTTRKPNVRPMSETEHTDQYFVPVSPVDHLADVVQPPVTPPGPTPTPPPPTTGKVDLKPIYDSLGKLKYGREQADAKIAVLTQRMNDLEDLVKRIINAKVAINVGKNFGHAHSASGKLEV